jgi:hypothetical protein
MNPGDWNGQHEEFDKQFERRARDIDQLASDRLKRSELIERYLTACGDDLVLLALKGHLIIEGLLEMNLCRVLGLESLPQREADPELEFHQKLKLVRAVVLSREPGAKPNADLFCVIAKLNKVRNELAHVLMEPQEVQASVKRLIQSYNEKADLKLRAGEELPTLLKECIKRLCGFLDEVRIQTYKIKRDVAS